jgi:hypothetical protein
MLELTDEVGLNLISMEQVAVVGICGEVEMIFSLDFMIELVFYKFNQKGHIEFVLCH